MKITIEPATGRPFELAGHGHTSPADLRINGELVAETAEYLRATVVDVFNRGNRRTSVTFSVTREHASVEAAQLYLLRHEVNVPRSGLVTFEAEQARGSLWMYDAVLNTVSSSHVGATTLHSYSILGGEISNINPNQLAHQG